MSTNKILSVGYSVPAKHYSQDTVYQMFGYKTEAVKRVFRNSHISKRHCWISPARLPMMSWQELTEEYEKGALTLSLQAIEQCMDNYSLDDLGCLIYSSCTGYTCPGMSHYIAKELCLRDDLVHTNILGMGCESLGSALKRAVDYVTTSGKRALVVNAEICTSTYFPAPEKDMECTVANAIFADSASALLVGTDDNPYHPRVIDIQSYFNKDHFDLLGYTWRDGRLRVRLDKTVPKVSGVVIKELANRIMTKNNLVKEDISFWGIHPGGMKVINEVKKTLDLSDDQLKYTWQVLHDYGNCSSATIAMVSKYLQRDVQPPATGLVITMGAGFECHGALIRWLN